LLGAFRAALDSAGAAPWQRAAARARAAGVAGDFIQATRASTEVVESLGTSDDRLTDGECTDLRHWMPLLESMRQDDASAVRDYVAGRGCEVGQAGPR
jgi:hypothetical protein